MNKQSGLQILGWLLWWLFIIIGAFTAGYFLTMQIYSITGRPAEPVAYILYGLLSLAVLALECLVVFVISRYTRHGKLHDLYHDNSYKAVSEAMNRMARGDFNVSLDPGELGFNKYIDNINTMAKELGTMETLRQDFVANVSHEMQSPLTSISGYIELLENEATPPIQRKHYFQIVKAESDRLSKLCSNLLKLSSLDSGSTPLCVRPYDLDEQLQNTVILLDPQWSRKNIAVTATLEKVAISADEGLLSQVWMNLLHNAAKFTPEGGSIHVTLTTSGGIIICTIADSGIGIAPEDQRRIFERFYKADKSHDRSVGGNGLGLSLVKKIVELHGGSVSVASEAGKGTTFTVTL